MPEADPGKPNPPKQHRDWRDYVPAIFLVVTLIAAATAAVFTGIAAWYTRQQWITAHDTLVVSQRAFVSVPIGYIRVFVVRDAKTQLPFLGVRSILANSGNTRTRDLGFLIKCTTSTDKLTEPWGLLRQGTEERLPQVIGPQNTIFAFCGFKQADVAQIANGNMYGYLLVDIRYRDIFQPTIQHVTQLSSLTTVTSYRETGIADKKPSFDTSIQFQPIGAHNCADEDCPND